MLTVRLHLISNGCNFALALPCDGLSDKTVHTWTVLVRDYANPCENKSVDGGYGIKGVMGLSEIMG